MTFKEKIFRIFSDNLQDKILSYQHTLNELQESVSNETKRTAGDKHETALAMLQSEQSRIAKLMQEAKEAQRLFLQVDIISAQEKIVPGSLVKTKEVYFLIGIALPKIVAERETIYAISPNAPLGCMLMGKRAGDRVVVNGQTHDIVKVE